MHFGPICIFTFQIETKFNYFVIHFTILNLVKILKAEKKLKVSWNKV